MKKLAILSVPPSLKRPLGGIDFGSSIASEAIARWASITDHVVSLNGCDEAPGVRKAHPGLQVVEMPEPGRVSISGMLDFARASAAATTIIANVDCVPIDTNFTRSILELVAPIDAIMLRRVNIGAAFRPSSFDVFHGIDAFVLGKEALDRADASGYWKIADPVWDIWFPIMLKAKGASVSGVVPYPLMHVDHAVPSRTNDAWIAYARKLLEEFPLHHEVFGGRFAGKPSSNLSKKDIQRVFDEVAAMIYTWNKPLGFAPQSFNALWSKILQERFGPDEGRMAVLANREAGALVKWLYRSFPRLVLSRSR